jgi:predicted component of type VI protein secretion system
MPKLTLSFKGHVIDVYHLEKEETCLGRDQTCDISIDSLAIAPQQAIIRKSSDGEYQLEATNEEFPVLLNREKIEVSQLSHGDVIQVGKHTLTYADDVMELGADLGSSPKHDKEALEADSIPSGHPPSGMLQIINGENFGRIIPLSRNMTRIGHTGGDCAMISKRDDGYFLTFLEGPNPPIVNRISIGNGAHRLNDGDIIEVGGTKMQFHS